MTTTNSQDSTVSTKVDQTALQYAQTQAVDLGETGTSSQDSTVSTKMDQTALQYAQTQAIDSGEAAESCPARIGKYPVQRYLAKGGMGQVYLGTHPQLNVPVVIKVIRPEHNQNSAYGDRLMKEARLASKLNHPNIVRVYDSDWDGDICFIVQEYVEGGDLSVLLQSQDGGLLEPDRVLEIITGVTRGLVAAEKVGIVHRDIKPSNILLDLNGEPKIADLGLAKHTSQEDETISDFKLTQETVKVGSPAYMAPEQVEDNGTIDTRTDIYALGVTFYELLTGKMPFSGTSMQEMFAKHLLKDVDDPCLGNPNVPQRFGRIVQKMAARRQEDRFQTASELLAALQQAGQPWWRRHLLATAVSLLLTVMAATTGITHSLAPAKDGPMQSALDYFAQGHSAKAKPILEKLLDTHPRNAKAWYALGLCQLDSGARGEVEGVVKRLPELPEGKEFVAHLQALQAVEDGDERTVLDTVSQWEGQAAYPSPLFYAKGMAFFKKRDYEKAQDSLQKSVKTASVFGFQRFAAVDALARLFTAGKQPAQARDVYASALGKKAVSQALPPSLYTNYAMILMNAGDTEGAAKPLRLALEMNPNDPFSCYLQKAIDRKRNKDATEQLQATLSMIDNVNAALEKQTKSDDDWSSSPLVLTFLPPENLTPASGRIGEEKYLVDLLTEAVQSQNSIPVVDRESLDAILREHKISASDLASPAARLQIGRFLPASILVRTRYSLDDKITVRLQLIDVATSENLAILTEQAPKSDDRMNLALALSQKLLGTMAERKPIQAQVTEAGSETFDINVGRFHGLSSGRSVAVYAVEKNASLRKLRRRTPLAKGEVEDVDEFEATVRFAQGEHPDIAAGMLVLATAEELPQK